VSRLKCVLSDLDDTLVPEMEPERETLLITCGLATERYGTNAELMVATVGEACAELWESGTRVIFAVRSPTRAGRASGDRRICPTMV